MARVSQPAIPVTPTANQSDYNFDGVGTTAWENCSCGLAALEKQRHLTTAIKHLFGQ